MDKLKPCEVGQVKFDAQGNREGTITGSGHWPELVKVSGLTGRWLRLEMTPIAGLDGADWSLLESTQDSLREHMAELHRKDAQLKAANARIAELDAENKALRDALASLVQGDGCLMEAAYKEGWEDSGSPYDFEHAEESWTESHAAGDARRAAALLEKK